MFNFKFEPRITIGEIMLIGGLVISTVIFFAKSGRWIGIMETKFQEVQSQLFDLKYEQRDETSQINKIRDRVSKIEGTVNAIKRQTQ